MSPAERRRLSPAQALALGILHGPAELLPISSSAHVETLPRLLGWSYRELDEEQRKSFEVILHAAAAAGLLVSSRREVLAALHHLDARGLAAVMLSTAPPALTGLLLERPIEQRLGTPATIAAGLLGGSLLMALAARAGGSRRCREAGALDGLWLGLAQTLALIPGVSRAGASGAAARLRGFAPGDADRFSRLVGLPVIGGAMALRTLRMSQGGREQDRTALTLGAVASLLSTLASAKLMARARRGDSLWPYVAYRTGLALVLAARLRASG